MKRTTMQRINITRPICEILVGKQHKHIHRMSVGVAVMGVGVTIAKVVGHSEVEVISFVGDGIGYAVHGLGLVPFIDYLIDQTDKESE